MNENEKFGRSVVSKSMKTLKQDLTAALAKHEPDKEVTPDNNKIREYLMGGPVNKAKDLSVDDCDKNLKAANQWQADVSNGS